MTYTLSIMKFLNLLWKGDKFFFEIQLISCSESSNAWEQGLAPARKS